MNKTPDLKTAMSFRLDSVLVEKLREASEKTEANPYAPLMTDLVERGIKLALQELKAKNHKR